MLNITFRQLRIFHQVAQDGSLTLAASKLNLTKAALSLSLQELEKQLGYPLFDRAKNRLTINERGEQLLPVADQALQNLDEIAALSATPAVSRPIRIGASHTIGNHLLPAILGSYKALNNQLNVEVTISNTSRLTEQLESYELDLALIEGQCKSSQINERAWHEDRMIIIAPAGYSDEAQNLSALNDSHWILREPGSGTRAQFDQALAPALTEFHIALELDSNEAIINAVAAGLGFSYMSDLTVSHACKAGLIERLDQLPQKRRILKIITMKNKVLGKSLNGFIEHCLHWSTALEQKI